MSHLKYGINHFGYRYERHFSQVILRYSLVPFTCVLILQPFDSRADLYFNPNFLSDNQSAVADLSAFEKGQEIPPGTYRVDIYLNNVFMSTSDVTFKSGHDGLGLVPCITRSRLIAMGVNSSKVPGVETLADGECTPLTSIIKDATIQFDVGQQRLNITIPQDYMNTRARGFIQPERWDNGINAGLINYNFTGNNVHSYVNGDSSYAYLNLQDGINLGAWRFRDNSTWSYSSSGIAGNKNKWQHINSWLERDITPLRSRLTIGDGYTSGDIFDGINFRGVQLASDENMLPDSLKGFAPVIHGIAHSTAQVSIKQNGYEIYQNTVPPGPFSIDDLYAAGNGGDLQVTVKEADGSSHVFSVPWSTVPMLQREGQTRYAITAGEYRSGNYQQGEPTFFQGTAIHGLLNGWTIYGGTQLATRYRSVNAGTGKNMGEFGAISLDITNSNATLPDNSKHQGQSVRFLYNKSLDELGTNFQLVGYRYSTHGYYSLADTTYLGMSGYSVKTQDDVIQVKPALVDYYNLTHNKRGKLQISVTQQLGRVMTLYLSGSHQSYWGSGEADEQLQAGLNTSVGYINWTVSYSQTKSAWLQGRDQLLAISINIPFSHWMRSDNNSVWRHANASYSMSSDLNGQMTNLAGLYGTLLDDNNLSYNLQSGYTRGEEKNSGSTGYAALNYRGGYGNANIGYAHNDTFRQVNYGISGGILAHANGVTLSQPLNDTVVLVKAPGAAGVKVENQSGVRTDWRGYAVLPYATEYRENRIALDTNTLNDKVDLDDAVVNVVPTHGSIVRAEFKTRIGMKILMTINRNGKPIPFGSLATSMENQSSSIVGENGQVYLSGMPLNGNIKVKWADDANSSCIVSYHIPSENQKIPLVQLTAQCR